jgi:hypothetical protein
MRRVLFVILFGLAMVLPLTGSALAAPAVVDAGSCTAAGGSVHVRGPADVRNISVGVGLGVIHIVDGVYGHNIAGQVPYDFAIRDNGTWSNGCTGWDATRAFSIGHGYCATIYRVNSDGTITRQTDSAHGKTDWGFGIHSIGSPYWVDAHPDNTGSNAASTCFDSSKP